MSLAVIGAGLGLPVFSLTSVAYGADEKQTISPEVGKPLQDAQAALKGGNYKGALNSLRQAEALPNRTAYENQVIGQLSIAAAVPAGECAVAAKSAEGLAGRISGETALVYDKGIGECFLRANDYTQSLIWLDKYVKAGGNEEAVRPFLAQAAYLKGDYATAKQESQALVQADERAGRAPVEKNLLLWLSCIIKLNARDTDPAYGSILEKLVTYYPKHDYWVDLQSSVQRKLSDRLTLDFLRLQLATGTLARGTDDESTYSDFAQRSLAAGYPGEAQKIVQAAYDAKIFGGAQAARESRLKAAIDTKAAEDKRSLPGVESEAENAKDGTALVNTGLDWVLYGDTAKGIPLMEKGVQKGGGKHPDDDKLHLGFAYYVAGQKDKAIKTLGSVGPADGAGDLARLWIILAKSGKGA